MRLNEKHLTAFATSTAPSEKEGYLMKRGEMNKAFQKRWFVLKGNMLFYFEKKGEKEPIGVIILEGCTVELAEGADSYTFELVFQGSGTRTYILSAETQEEMEAWMKAIACAGYEYMKLMVSELQRQMDELNMAQNNSSAPLWNRPGSEMVATNSSQPALIDVTFPDSANRSNPFNTISDNLDPFDAVPFAADAGMPQIRSFEEMHKEFGGFIQEKMREAATRKMVQSKPNPT